MPCMNEGAGQYFAEQEKRNLIRYLCALLSAMEPDQRVKAIIAAERQSGIRKGEIAAWWKAHKDEDARRRSRGLG